MVRATHVLSYAVAGTRPLYNCVSTGLNRPGFTMGNHVVIM